MTAYATRSPLQLLTNTYHMMAEQPSSNRRTSARLKVKDDVFGVDEPAKIRANGVGKVAKSSAKAGAGPKGKRKMDYDEEDDGFIFKRAKSKRTQATSAEAQNVLDVVAPVVDDKPVISRKLEQASDKPADRADETPRRRARQNQTDIISPKPHSPQQKRSPQVRRRKEEQDVQAIAMNETTSKQPTKIALPFADTPIIRRNKEMRKGNNESRRSSLGMRGRRASSLIDSGTSSALPHDQVETTDFYKHIESSLLEPRRMRQLLMWCGARALGEEPGLAIDDRPAKLAARQIQQELLKDFSGDTKLSDWFSREDSPVRTKVLKPNPRNLANLAKIEELEQKLKTLRAEQEAWSQIQKTPSSQSISISPLPPIENLSLAALPITTVNSQPAMKSILLATSPSATQFTSAIQGKIDTVTTDFELNLDQLLDSVNSLGQHLAAAEGISKRVLSNVARVLDERDKKLANKEGTVGPRDTLRALTRVIDRG